MLGMPDLGELRPGNYEVKAGLECIVKHCLGYKQRDGEGKTGDRGKEKGQGEGEGRGERGGKEERMEGEREKERFISGHFEVKFQFSQEIIPTS